MAANGDDGTPKLKIMTLGDSAVGKSSLVVRYTESTFEPDRLSTIGIDFRKKRIEVNGQSLDLQIWDTAGQERFHTITAAYYRGVDAVLLVYDVTNRTTFSHVRKWIRDVEANNSRFESVKIILVANKVDLPANAHRVSKSEGEEIANEFGIPLIETSAKTGENVESAFTYLAESCTNSGKVAENEKIVLQQEPSGSGCICSR